MNEKPETEIEKAAMIYSMQPENCMPGFMPMGRTDTAFRYGAEWMYERAEVLIEALERIQSVDMGDIYYFDEKLSGNILLQSLAGYSLKEFYGETKKKEEV